MIKIHPFIEVLGTAASGAIFAGILDHGIGVNGSVIDHLSSMLLLVLPPQALGIAPIIAAITLLAAFGAASTFYFRPLSRKGGFACGFGVIGALSIVLP